MFLFGLEVVFASYAATRLYEKIGKKTEENRSVMLVQDVMEDDEREREKDLHYIKMSGLSIGSAVLTHVNPIFLLPTLLGFTYTSIPYLRLVENSLVKEKKVDGYVLYGIADMMTLGLGSIVTASIGVGLVHGAKFVISNAKQNSKQSVINIFAEQPNHVWLLKDGIEIEVPLDEVVRGDIVVINTGDVIPIDGIVILGMATVDQHTLTGESQPAEKMLGDTVFASTQVMSGRIHVQAENSGSDTTVAKITDILNHSVDFKTHSQLKGEQWADNWNLPVLGLAFAAMPWLGAVGTVVILNGHIAQNIRIIAPLSTLNYLNLAAHKGILVKDGRVLEDLSDIDTFLFDKTGTLTSEVPEVGRIWVYLTGYSENDILAFAAAAEAKLQHPIARAILNRAVKAGVILPEVNDSDYSLGYGIAVHIENKLIRVGSRRFMEKEGISVPENLDEQMEDAYHSGHSLVMLAIDKQFAGVLEMRASVRPEVFELLANLRKRGVRHLAIVSGDHREPTQKLAHKLGMDDYFYDVLPQNKAEIVEKLQMEGHKVCFIGDGVNDTIAMKKANISISLSGATSVATDTAQIILMDGSLKKLDELLVLAHELDKNLQNGWIFNVVPGAVTIISAFTLHISIITALLLSSSGLGLGIVNAMLPLRQITNEKRTNLKME
ncbi:MAG: heavy metal translocating P-type ATPase [Methylococcales bacterium]|nr:heavy metal translocating P-type ATPase [Methylococcales bacterium]MDD5753367.1 heavy metal translocating P-type ATPase [Methylococcales bacterium]